MSEQLHLKGGGEHLLPTHEQSEKLAQNQESELTDAEKAHGRTEHVEATRAKVEQHAVSGKEYLSAHAEQTTQHPVLINKELKNTAFHRSMVRTRKKLSAPARAFSHIIHTDIVDRGSEFVGKTAARPSGLLGGSVFAFFGSSALLWITKHYGYEYNFLAIVLLFAIGMVVGLGIEIILKSIRNKRA